MNKQILLLILLLASGFAFSQQKNLTGKVVDSATNVPVSGASIMLMPGNETDITDASGRFFYKGIRKEVKTISISAIGYQSKTFSVSDFKNGKTISISPRQIQLSDIIITAHAGNPYKTISETDIKMRGVSNSQEVLRIVPGLFIGQHQGGGKAEQIFLRGFDNDHGTDIQSNLMLILPKLRYTFPT